ncbi:MAG: ComEC/Rec2 family competence protein [Gemmatimonadota bacterium]
MGHPFKGQGAVFLLLLPFFGGLLSGLAAGSAWPAAAALFLLTALLSAAFRLRPFATASAAMALCGALAAGRAALVDPSQASPFLSGEVVLRAAVSEVRPAETGWVGTAEDAVVSSIDDSRSLRLAKVRLCVRNPESAVAFPSEVRAMGRLHPVRSRGNPGEAPREWGAMAEGVQYAFFADAGKTVFLRDGRRGTRPAAVLRRARERIGRWIARHAGASDGALYLKALTTGECPPSSHPMVVLLRKTGLAHILAISGMNVAVFFSLHAFLVRAALWAVRRRHGTPDLTRVAAIASLPVCWAYVLVAGAPVSAVRAAGMITAAVLVRDAAGVRAGAAAWTLLFFATAVIDPFLMLSPSFLLSYGAAYFLIAEFAGRVRGKAPASVARKALRGAGTALAASAVAFLGTLPVSALFFGGLPLGAILWNVVFGPVLGTAGVAGAFLAAVGGAAGVDLLGVPVRGAARGLDAALVLLARLSGDGWGYVALPPPGIAAAACSVAAAAAGSLVLRERGKRAWPAVAGSALAFLAWIHLPYAALPDRRLAVAALNVGRGAAHVVSFPAGGTMVVDCGSALHGDAGSRILAPFLRGLGVRRVDVLVLTHPHEDHVGGAAALLDAFPVGEIWIPAGIPAGAFGEAVARQAGRIRGKSAGEVYSAGGASVVVRSSAPEGRRGGRGAARRRSVNERSLVLEIRHRLVSVWLPGDVEQGPAAWGPDAPGDGFRILFLPHHGSPGAAPDAWIRAAAPAVTVSQNSNCFARRNLVPSVQDFFLENGTFTLRSDGREASCAQDGMPGIWRFLWRVR